MDQETLAAIPNGPVAMAGPTWGVTKRKDGSLELHVTATITVNGVPQAAKFVVGKLEPAKE